MKSDAPAFGLPRNRVPAILYLCTIAVVAAFQLTPMRERLDSAALDATQRVVRKLTPPPAVENVVIVGIDEETERGFPEPLALWHRHLGELLTAIARGNPRVIALDVVLPERSYDEVIPDLNADLMRGLVAAKHPNRLVVGLRLNKHGEPQPTDKALLAAIGRDALGLAYVHVDRDGMARRIELPSSRSGGEPSLLAQRIAAMLGLKPRAGIIDFACGAPFAYIPMQEVIAWGRDRPADLDKAFSGKTVLVGHVGPDEDPVRQPLSLASWVPKASAPPGVVLLAQTVRALQSDRILSELPTWAVALLVAVGAAIVFVGGPWRTWSLTALVVLVVAGSVYAAYLRGVFVPPASPLAAVVLGATLRSTWEALEHRRFRVTIERQFAGYVSHNLLQSILAGAVDPREPRKYANLGFLFADIRGFTTMVERDPASRVLSLLNRYYEAVTPAIHAYDGTIDNFRGDGILAIFGAPRPAPDGPRRAVLAAREMFARLDLLNVELAREGSAPLDIGIGLACGDAVAGNVGTTSRYGYSAVGDAVNVSARLQAQCKPLKMRIIASETVARECADELPFVPLGQLELAGHAPIEAFGVPKSNNVTGAASEKSLRQSGSYA